MILNSWGKWNMLEWVPCDSRSDMEARASGEKVIGTMMTSDANAWGYVQTPEGWHLNVGYASIGLIPKAILIGQRMLIGINECLVGYDLSTKSKYFSYRMPLVFHEFVDIDDSLIVRDEMGFAGITLNGIELWKFITEGVIESYVVTSSKISGKTTDGSCFSFGLPIKKQ